MNRRIDNPDGMFPREKIPLGEVTDADREWMQQTINIMCNLDTRIEWIARVIKPLVGELTPEGNLIDPASRDDRQATARELYFKIRDLSALIKSGDIRNAVLWGIDIGALAQRLDVIRYEPDVVRGKRVQAGSAAGSLARKKQGDQTRDDFLRNVEARIKRRGNRKQPSKTGIVVSAAKDCGITQRQAWRYWRENQKKNH